jgi:hypothetical protein
MKSKALTVESYLESLSPDRREAIGTVRKVILGHLPAGYYEGMHMGMIGYVIPLESYPTTYNGQPLMIAALASQKNYMALYLMCVYGSTDTASWFKEELRKSGMRLDMGKACIRFTRVDKLPLDLVGRTIARVSIKDFIAMYERSRAPSGP